MSASDTGAGAVTVRDRLQMLGVAGRLGLLMDRGRMCVG